MIGSDQAQEALELRSAGQYAPEASEIVAGLLRNAFVEPIKGGLENAAHGKAGAG